MNRKTVVVGITSGIAAYKMLDLITLLKKDANVIVVMTKSAAKMISPKDFEKVSGNKVYIDLFEKDFDYKKVLKSREVDHIRIADMADLVVVAPATANVIAKIAHGLADDFLTTMLLATQAPIMVFPSMNVHMWGNPIVQENIAKIKSRGFIITDPDSGDLACGYHGKGRLPEPTEIYREVSKILQKTTRLAGKKIIVTAGGTTEPIDGVRYITNHASGKMGVAIAESCFLQGAKVLLVRSKTSVLTRYDIPQITFETAGELEKILQKEVKNYGTLFQTAAVSDFKIDNSAVGKISSNKEVILKLTPRKKIIDQVKIWNPDITLVGFKAMWGQEKLRESSADAVVVNDVSKPDRGFGVDTNEVTIIKKGLEKKHISLRSKQEVAEEIVSYLLF
ncbi:MAG: bifunctional phosphopantothenoylcysteine decarboxylase/phosphopantothenate--cysteine ligase CoaBC [Candidatus Levyibacteriota bacterium]|nr:MAG: bifunctional phosphopantothenoylcysteine decarboxylase/phosphopantothenate--cysteine ligase CoaBC [Candidatus Levybacteria bacterium]